MLIVDGDVRYVCHPTPRLYEQHNERDLHN